MFDTVYRGLITRILRDALRPLSSLSLNEVRDALPPIRIYGRNNATAQNTYELLSSGGLANYFPTVAAQLSIVSTSADDSITGSGARYLLIEGLDANFDLISEVIGLSGLTPVQTVNSYIRLNKATVIRAGNYVSAYNHGEVSITHNGTLYDAIRLKNDGTGTGQTQTARYCIPNGYKGNLYNVAVSSDRLNALMKYHLHLRLNADIFTGDVGAIITSEVIAQDRSLNSRYEPAYIFEPKTEFWMETYGAVGSQVMTWSIIVLTKSN